MFRVIFPKDSRGRFPVTRGCDTLGAPGRDSPTPSQLCRVPLDTDSRSPKTFGDIKPTTVMRSEGSRLGILSQSRESFGIEFRTFAGQEVKTQNPKNPRGMKPETTQSSWGSSSSLNKFPEVEQRPVWMQNRAGGGWEEHPEHRKRQVEPLDPPGSAMFFPKQLTSGRKIKLGWEGLGGSSVS